MDERIKRIFQKHFRKDVEGFNSAPAEDKGLYAHAMVLMAKIYSEIYEMSFDEASNELHQGADEGEEKSRC